MIVPDLNQFQNEQDAEPRHFGVCVSALTSERNSVPIVMEKLLEHVEMHGLYTEGIYRKSGSANRMKELKQLLQAGLAMSVLLTSLHHCSLPLNSFLFESICHVYFKTSILAGIFSTCRLYYFCWLTKATLYCISAYQWIFSFFFC